MEQPFPGRDGTPDKFPQLRKLQCCLHMLYFCFTKLLQKKIHHLSSLDMSLFVFHPVVTCHFNKNTEHSTVGATTGCCLSGAAGGLPKRRGLPESLELRGTARGGRLTLFCTGHNLM